MLNRMLCIVMYSSPVDKKVTLFERKENVRNMTKYLSTFVHLNVFRYFYLPEMRRIAAEVESMEYHRITT